MQKSRENRKQKLPSHAITELREQALQQASEAAALAERNRIARELHDSIKQQIFSMSVSAAAAKAHWRGENLEEAREAIEDIQRCAQEAQVEMDALLQQLRPAPLENTNLIEALTIQAQALGFRTGAQMHVSLETVPQHDLLLPGTLETIFRLVQEAFANIAKHARAHHVWLTLQTKERALHIEIRDDGQGFDNALKHQGMGLNNMRRRTQELHGVIEISSQPGQGATLLIDIPLLEALQSPEEEALQRYELARANELAYRNYQLCTNASFLGLIMMLIDIMILASPIWNVVVLGIALVALAGYGCGRYYQTRVALSTGRTALAAVKLARRHYRVSMELARLACVGVFYILNLVGLLHTAGAVGWWLLIGVFFCQIALTRLSRRGYYRDTDRYYSLISIQEMRWELERQKQFFTRSLTIWCVACTVGLISAHSLFVLPPQTPAQLKAYAIAVILLMAGIGLVYEYLQTQRWKQQLHIREQDGQEKED